METRRSDFDRQSERMDRPEGAANRTVPAYGSGMGSSRGSMEHDYGSEKGGNGITGKALIAGGIALAVAGGALALRGFKGSKKSSQSKEKGVLINTSLTINRPPEEVYAFWRNLENLPRFMQHLAEVRELDDRHSHWVAKVPGDLAHIEWDATIISEEPGRFIAWHSLPEADIDNSGEVRFALAPGSLGTEVHAIISYRPPAGAVGSAVASLLNPGFEKMVKNDLRRFKNLMETGEIATIEGQTSGRKKTGRSKNTTDPIL